MFRHYAAYGMLLSCFVLQSVAAFGQLNNQKPRQVQNVGVEEHLGDTIPLDLTFATSDGDSVTIAELMQDGKPVILNPVYYNCPMLCTMVINAIYTGVKDVKWNPGDDYNIITFSFNPDEDYKLAASVKDSIMQEFGREGTAEGWHFLTGKEDAIRRLTDAVGFKYERVAANGQYAHSAAIMFLSPKGVVTRYLYGIKYKEFDIRNGLYDAADGEIGSTVDQVLLYCYVYNSDTNSYVPVAWRIMQIGGVIIALAVVSFLGFMWLGHKFTNNKKKSINGSA